MNIFLKRRPFNKIEENGKSLKERNLHINFIKIHILTSSMSIFCDLCSEGERIWAGVDGVYGAMSLLEPVPTARGSLCYYKSREGEDKWREAETFK